MTPSTMGRTKYSFLPMVMPLLPTMKSPTVGPENAAAKPSLIPQEALAIRSMVLRAMGVPSRITVLERPLRRKSSTSIG